ncbi:MAG: hypothetical protein FWC11_01285, partial [Firmicutes bacterium]|nr:hypothetical protein [Bacillota bacterium]
STEESTNMGEGIDRPSEEELQTEQSTVEIVEPASTDEAVTTQEESIVVPDPVKKTPAKKPATTKSTVTKAPAKKPTGTTIAKKPATKKPTVKKETKGEENNEE